MNKKFQSIRGMHDFLPNDLRIFNHIKNILKKILNNYCYTEIRMPILEYTTLFQRTIGNITEIIEKEMYSFIDQSGNSLTLRPEGTVGCVRACIEHGLIYNQKKKFWYLGPMFRYERPQYGRYRQFYQLGVETFGFNGPSIDVELIMLTIRFWKELKILPYLQLEVNSIGSIKSRSLYQIELKKFLNKNKLFLDLESRNKILTNPLRILDSKNHDTQKLLKKGPQLHDYFDKKSYVYFENLCKLLDKMNIDYKINNLLVRGLDYYNDTVFEWTTTKLGAQNTICAGGRYDFLSKYIGKLSIPSIGLAIGMERLTLLFKNIFKNFYSENTLSVDINIFASNEDIVESIQLGEEIRNIFPNLKILIDYSGSSLKKLLKKMNNFFSLVVLFIFKNKNNEYVVFMKNLKKNSEFYLFKNELIEKLSKIFNISNS